jgi:hypothetical protein
VSEANFDALAVTEELVKQQNIVRHIFNSVDANKNNMNQVIIGEGDERIVFAIPLFQNQTVNACHWLISHGEKFPVVSSVLGNPQGFLSILEAGLKAQGRL